MDWNWQLSLVLLCVTWATVVIVRRAIRLWTGRGRSAGSCASGACGSCPSSAGDAAPAGGGFVSIESLTRDRDAAAQREADPTRPR